jgi:hypothetical protein
MKFILAMNEPGPSFASIGREFALQIRMNQSVSNAAAQEAVQLGIDMAYNVLQALSVTTVLYA